MSQYLNFYLKKKDSEERICVGYFCTTPAREISSIGAFPYTEEDVLLEKEIISSYINDLKEERDSFEKHLNDCINKKHDIEQNIFKCSSKEVAEMFMEHLDDINYSISESKETISDWDYRIQKIYFITDLWEDNKEKWNLYYNNC